MEFPMSSVELVDSPGEGEAIPRDKDADKIVKEAEERAAKAEWLRQNRDRLVPPGGLSPQRSGDPRQQDPM
jgi:hypothetical protein